MTKQPLTLLAVHAHPDDEAFSMGGTYAKAAAVGIHTVLICATRGDVGEIHDPDLDPLEAQARLAAIREGELRQACAILGIAELHFLGYRDSGMAGTPENDDRRNFYNADREEATERVTRLIRQCRPHVVVTYNEHGGYGHPDHIAAHRTTLAAVAAAADPARFPEQELPAWDVAKLYYTAFPRSALERLGAALRERGIAPPFGGEERDPADFTVPDAQVTTRVDVRDYLTQKRDALSVHRTQLGVDHFALTLPEEVIRETFGFEAYTRVQSRVPAPETEDSLFAGLV
ncbi:MAG: N-acetyl-1-D-myo-inositol-2-amino-2-deoxy-alpha-D-glucopyranoside deacetylase [Chloroflexota bacterium]